MTQVFEYADSPQIDHADFVLYVPSGIQSKADLLMALATAGHFPDYFGNNWDALDECLCDFTWLGDQKVVIVHKDLPLQNNPSECRTSECRTYLRILQTALDTGSNRGETRMIFPIQERAPITSL